MSRDNPQMRDLYVEFEGRQLVIRSNAGEVLDAIADVYAPMVVKPAAKVFGGITIDRVAALYRVHGERGEHEVTAVDDVVDLVKSDVLFQMVSAHRMLLWLHAGAVELDDMALVLPAPSGSGKSTLTTLLCELGWRLMAEDAVALEMSKAIAVPFPQIPFRRIHPGVEVPWPASLDLPKRLAALAPGSFRRERARIGAIVVPGFRFGAAAVLRRQRGGEAALDLLRNCLNFGDHGDAAVERAARLASEVPAYELTYGSAEEAADLLHRLSEWDRGNVARTTLAATPFVVG